MTTHPVSYTHLDVTAGLSLGEYGALIASGAMTAVLGLDPQIIEDICKKTADETNSVVSVANYNCPGQIVITLSLIHI